MGCAAADSLCSPARGYICYSVRGTKIRLFSILYDLLSRASLADAPTFHMSNELWHSVTVLTAVM